MARADHQPSEERVVRHRQEVGEYYRVCGRTVAIVLAIEEATTPLVVLSDDPEEEPIVCSPEDGGKPVPRPVQLYKGKPAVSWVVDAARKAQLGEVFVVCSPALTHAVSGAIHGVKRKGMGSEIQIVEIDPGMLVERARLSADFEMFGLHFGVLEVVRGLADTVFIGYDNAIVLQADNVRITTDHIYELCLDAMEHPEVDAISSWISWLRRPPYLFTRAFLESIEERGLTDKRDGSDRAAPCLNVRDHVFGEEKLAANPVVPASVSAFFEGVTLSAREALEVARHSLAHPDEPLSDPHPTPSLMGPVASKPLGEADTMLVDIAKAVLEAGPAEGVDADLDWADAFGKRCRLDFPLLIDRAHGDTLAYLDTAATSQRVDVALQAQRDYDEHENANVYRGAYELSAQSTFTYNDARKALEDFIGAKRRQTVFTANTTASINLVAQAWGEHNIGEGDLVVTALAEHHSNMLPFALLAERKGARIEYVPYGPDGRVDREAYRAVLAQHPKLVSIAAIGNVFGIEAPVTQMAQEAHNAGARVLVDAAQSFAHKKLDVSTLGADWVAFSAHKAYGPMGIGALWISDEAFSEMDPLGAGGGTVSHVARDSYYLRPKSIQYEMGTPPVSQAVGWAAAVGYLEALGWDDIARHDAALVRHAVDGLHRIDGVNVMGDHEQPDGQAGLVSFTLRGLAPADLAAFLGKLGVAIRSGGHCALPLHASLGLIGTGRLSFGVYTTRDDVDAALVAVEACRRMWRR